MSNTELKITLENQDHTFGNLIRTYLLQDSRVLFAGYRIIHPLDNKLLLNIKSKSNYDCNQILEENINFLKKDLQNIKKEFEKELLKRT